MVDSEGNGNPETERGLILNSRILWTFSSLYIKDRDERFLSVADRAYSYIEDNFIDTVYGGAVYTVDNTGNWINEIKSIDRKSTRLNSSHVRISYAVFCLKKKKKKKKKKSKKTKKKSSKTKKDYTRNKN